MSKKDIPVFQMRASGILLHPASLPGQWGIGTLGNEAFTFVQKLRDSAVSYWQMLPLSPTGFGNSPYQSWSSIAGNSLLICPLSLQQDGLLPGDKAPEQLYVPEFSEKIDYDYARQSSEFFLNLAFDTYNTKGILKEEFTEFCRKERWWLDEHAVFAAIRKHMNQLSLQEWPSGLRKREVRAMNKIKDKLQQEIEFQKFVQFLFYRQWFSLREYANSVGVSVIGDLPIYVAADNVEVWTAPEMFAVDKNLRPVSVAGVPPDYFSETGQLWGNPVYRWNNHQKNGFRWWHRRLQHAFRMYDAVRIDHFRGFADYWSIPAKALTAETGKWKKAPGKKFFERFQKLKGNIPVIAEDLGILSDDAIALRNHCGFPGMKILQFAFQNPAENQFLPHFYEKHCVVYTGTHDNNTLRGWIEEDTSEEERKFIAEYLNCHQDEITAEIIRLAWASVANTAIVPFQDIYNLDSSARMNLPGTVEGNWLWKMTPEQLDQFPAEKLKKLNIIFTRFSEKV